MLQIATLVTAAGQQILPDRLELHLLLEGCGLPIRHAAGQAQACREVDSLCHRGLRRVYVKLQGTQLQSGELSQAAAS